MPRLARALILLVLLVLAAAPGSARADGCDRYAGPFGNDSGPGTVTQPYRTPQRLANVLVAGQTGCLLDGYYDMEVDGPYVLNLRHGGAPGAPLTIRSAPGQRARLRGIVYLWEHSDHIVLSDLDIDGRRPVVDESLAIQPTGIVDNAKYTTYERDDITNHGNAICVVLGYPGWGEAVGTVLRQNTFHDCGGTDNQLEHSLYVDVATDVLVEDNLFLRSGTYAVHLYPDAHDTTIRHNVMVGNGGGVIFAGTGDSASTDDVVSQNVIAGTYRKPGIHSWWGSKVGTGNLAKDNCMSNSTTNVDVYYGGFTSQHNVIASPGFRDPANGDYRLAPGSPCLALVGYDTAAKLRGEPVSPDPTPTPTPSPTPSPSPSPTASPSVTPTPVPTASPVATPTASPTATQTPAPTASPSPSPVPSPSATPVATPAAPAVTPRPVTPVGQPGSGPDEDPKAPSVEAAVLYVDRHAFSASGGSARTAACRPRTGSKCRRAAG